LQNFTTSQNLIRFVATVGAYNAAIGVGLEFQPASGTTTGTIVIFVNDNGNVGIGGPMNTTKTINVSINTSGIFGAGSGFIGVTTLMSAGVFGIYRALKRKKIIPEESDPWENDEIFDVTEDNPLFVGSPDSLTPLYE